MWEPEWEPLRETPLAELFTTLPRATLELALMKYTRPLVKALGLPPQGALRKLPPEARVCAQRRTCSLRNDQECFPTARNTPWCFQPEGLPHIAAKAIQLWRENAYIIVVVED